MPRGKNGRGGRRQGQPGVAYQNRSDLNPVQPVRAASNQEYGARGQQEVAQQAIPLPATPPPQGRAAPARPAGPLPGEMGSLLRPTDRPNEPLTAGIPFGAGPGPEALNIGGDPTLIELREVYRLEPSEDLREVIAQMEAEGRG